MFSAENRARSLEFQHVETLSNALLNSSADVHSLEMKIIVIKTLFSNDQTSDNLPSFQIFGRKAGTDRKARSGPFESFF